MRTPIPHAVRPLHKRKNVPFSFYHPFGNVASLIANTASTRAVHSPWITDSVTNSRWRIEVYFRGYRGARDGSVSLFLQKEFGSWCTPQQTKYGIFIIGSTEHTEIKSTIKAPHPKSIPGDAFFARAEFVQTQSAK